MIIQGKVQGVFYRANAADYARSHDLIGWIKNRIDGTVECLAIGTEEKLQAFFKFCSSDPGYSQVDHIEAVWTIPTENFSDFKVVY